MGFLLQSRNNVLNFDGYFSGLVISLPIINLFHSPPWSYHLKEFAAIPS
jgi:hypothetical protein